MGSSLFRAYGHLSEDEEKIVVSNEDEVLELCDMHPAGTPLDIGYSETTEETNSVQKIKEVEEEKDCALPSSNNHPELFRHFDIVNDCSDHHFVDDGGKGQQSSQVGYLKDIIQEL